MSKFEEFADVVAEGAKGLAKEIFNGFEDQAEEDALVFARKILKDLMNWTIEQRFKKISRDELRDLVKAKQTDIEMKALTQAGIAQNKLQKFRAGLVDLVIEKACKLLL